MADDEAPIVITGHAYQRRATLEISGDRITWRARRGQVTPVAENIATSTHDVRDVTWLEKRHSYGAGILGVLSVIWMFSESVAFGSVTLAIAIALIVWRRMHPRYWLGLDLGPRWLVLRVDPASAGVARTLAARLEQRLITGELAGPPPALP